MFSSNQGIKAGLMPLAGLLLLSVLACVLLFQPKPPASVTPPAANATATQSVHDPDYNPYTTLPPDLDPDKSQGGVGWVFGRLVGVAAAPGTGSPTPYRNPQTIER
jgi:hypothetical protein